MPNQVLTFLDVPLDIEPKSSKEVYNNGRTQREQGDIDEV